MIVQQINAYKQRPKPILYRVADIETEGDEHTCVIQVIGKGLTFKIKPEKLLANDERIDYFSQKDIRTLTYLGYLNINSPKYKVLAKKHSEKLNKMVFAVHKRGEKILL
ncbi:MAG: hypothetical protein HWD59_05950 [Coxiellaceae bacterium]|nr:MAG: hypothetical protein HWD59_05950 [Coxiellaceae bacterium]